MIYKVVVLIPASHYLCDDVVFFHAIPNLVHCTVVWRKRGRIPHKVGPRFDVGTAVVIYFTHRNNESQSSFFDMEIIENKRDNLRCAEYKALL